MVFLTGLEEGIFPHQRSFTNSAELAEERRLAYVGITRARQRLYVSAGSRPQCLGPAQLRPAQSVPRRDPP